LSKIKVRVVDCYVYNLIHDVPEFLILKRNKNKIYEHLWQGVAGKIENNEAAWQTAIRELKEETGLDPLNIFIADHVSRFYETKEDRVNLVPVFGIEVDSKDVILSDEHVDFKWIRYAEAKNTLVWNGQKKGLKVVNEMITNNDDRMRWSKVNFK
tara:strand:- start:480 stop:944 length:465 start_codon:yes stop_codon:yes gene_type:complete